MLGAGLQFGRSRGGEDRFYNPAKARKNRQNQENLRRAQSDVTPTQSTTSSGTEEPENRVVKPSKPVPVEPPMPSPLCNLVRFLESITPSVPAQYPSKRAVRGWRNHDEYQPYFVLGDLWESFKEWSAYGAGVPLILNDSDSVVQYYVPYLSGIQLYMDPLKSSAKSRQHSEDSDVDSFRDSSSDSSGEYEPERGSLQYQRENRNHHLPKSEISQLSLNYQHLALQEGFSSDEGEPARPQSCLSFEYLERNQPWGREPLTDKILDLARRLPELKSIKSCDLLPSSWLSVAWYPIYRIPMGPTLKDLDACFLTFHSLHTPMTGNQCDHPPKILLPVFGLASYKLKAPLWIHNERLLLSSLLQAADDWLSTLQLLNTLPSSLMAVSISVLVVIVSLHLISFVLAIGAERRRSTAKVVPDQYDEYDHCVYASDASTAYGLSAFGLLLISQTVVNGVTKCLCFGKGLVRGSSRTLAIFFFIFSWVSFLGAEACLLAGSTKNAYHTKYRAIYGGNDLSCETLRKGVFAAGAALTFLSMVASIAYYSVHSKADTGGWEKQHDEGLGMTSSSFSDNRSVGQFEKL